MSDEAAIRDVIQVYFDCMFESSSDKTYEAFHPNAKITGYDSGQLMELDVASFAGFVASQPSAKEAGEDPVLEVLSVEIAGDTAVARVRDAYMSKLYLDTLSFLKTDGQWQIYNKLFHIEKTL